MNEDGLTEVSWSGGLAVRDPKPMAKIAGMEVVVSPHVQSDQAIVVGGKAIVSRVVFVALTDTFSRMGATTAEAAETVERMGSIIRSKIDDQLYETLRGTALDTNPEQTEMEECSLWGSF